MRILVVPIESIHIGERQRSDVPTSHIEELAKDIQENGLIHAITIDKSNELRAGFCRLSAIQSLKAGFFYASEFISPGFVPVAVVHHDDERSLFRLELMENLRRKNLSPIDEAKAIARMHRMLTADNPAWNEADTGKQLDKIRNTDRSVDKSRTEISESLLIDSFAGDPEVGKAKSRSDAVKIAKRKLEQQFMSGLGALMQTNTGTKYSLLEGDCQLLLHDLPLASFAGIITDPPYGIDADTFGEQAMISGHQYADTKENAASIAEEIFKLGFDLCQDDAHLYMFCDIRNFAALQLLARKHQWKTFDTPLIWSKPGIGHAPQPGFFSRRYEAILFAQKGNRKLSKSQSDVIEIPPLKDKIHAAQKPVDLFKVLMGLSFFPGERVLDPCAGAGTIFRAAHACNLEATGIEQDSKYANICREAIGSLGG
jgi:DNA modification methylase